MNTAWLWFKGRPTLVTQLATQAVLLTAALVGHHIWPDVVMGEFIAVLVALFFSIIAAQYVVLL